MLGFIKYTFFFSVRKSQKLFKTTEPQSTMLSKTTLDWMTCSSANMSTVVYLSSGHRQRSSKHSQEQ